MMDRLECEQHGTQQACFVCHHLAGSLRDNRPVGYVCSVEGDNPRPDAWCYGCEEKRLECHPNGDWCDESESFAGITLVCGLCYDRLREFNRDART